MADRTIGELEPVEIGSLPLAPDIYDDSKIPLEYQGMAHYITGLMWKLYALAAVQPSVEAAGKSADNAADAAKAANTSASNAASSAQSAADSAGKAQDALVHAPVIREDRWWIWDAQAREYVDTGVSALGNVMYATFWIDPKTGELYMVKPDKYTGPDFRLENGNLEVVVNNG